MKKSTKSQAPEHSWHVPGMGNAIAAPGTAQEAGAGGAQPLRLWWPWWLKPCCRCCCCCRCDGGHGEGKERPAAGPSLSLGLGMIPGTSYAVYCIRNPLSGSLNVLVNLAWQVQGGTGTISVTLRLVSGLAPLDLITIAGRSNSYTFSRNDIRGVSNPLRVRFSATATDAAGLTDTQEFLVEFPC